jgi:hypothetical protein
MTSGFMVIVWSRRGGSAGGTSWPVAGGGGPGGPPYGEVGWWQGVDGGEQAPDLGDGERDQARVGWRRLAGPGGRAGITETGQ